MEITIWKPCQKLAKLHGEEERFFTSTSTHILRQKTKAIPNQAAELGASHGNSPKESHLCRKFKTSSIKFLHEPSRRSNTKTHKIDQNSCQSCHLHVQTSVLLWMATEMFGGKHQPQRTMDQAWSSYGLRNVPSAERRISRKRDLHGSVPCKIKWRNMPSASLFAFLRPQPTGSQSLWFHSEPLQWRCLPQIRLISDRDGHDFLPSDFLHVPCPICTRAGRITFFLDRRLRRKCPGSTSERSVPISCGVFHRLGIGCVSKALSIQRWLLDKKCSMPTCLKPSWLCFWAMFWDCQLAISLGLLEFKRHSNEMLPGCQRDTPQCWWVYPFHLEKTASNSHHVQILMFHVIHMSSIEDIARLCRLDPTATQWWYASCQVSSYKPRGALAMTIREISGCQTSAMLSVPCRLAPPSCQVVRLHISSQPADHGKKNDYWPWLAASYAHQNSPGPSKMSQQKPF